MTTLPPTGNSSKRRLLHLLTQKRERGTLEQEIAIVGLAGRYPQAPDLFRFWDCLRGGRVCTTEIPLERWDLRAFYDPDPLRAFEGRAYCKWGGFLDGISRFDAAFFHVSPREAELMDPQERLFLEVAWCALEDAGYARDLLRPKQTGVFLGVTTVGYPWVLAEKQDPRKRVFPTASFASMANRVSHFFNLQGPSMPVDTMCSSSLTAVVLACQSILRGECDSALVGGVNLYPHSSKYLCLSQMGIVSQDGLTRSFGAGGKGFVPGEGVGAVFLKPLLQALKDGDRVYATILGGALSHAGRSSSFLAPNPLAQTALIIKALENARVSPRTISYIEAQGLGSELVDAVEIAGLTRAYREFTEDRQFCAIGALKPNFGHAEAASGIAQLTKVLLQLKERTLCPTLIHEPLNPQIRFEESPFYLQRDLGEWPGESADSPHEAGGEPRRAAICAHGAGGSSAHVVVEEFPEMALEPPANPPERCVVPFSARSRPSLRLALRNHLDYLRRPVNNAPADGQFLRNMAFTLQTRREPMTERIALVADSPADLALQLETILDADADGALDGAAIGPPESSSAGRDSAGMRALQAAQDWVQGQPLAGDVIIPATHARPISLPGYAFEPTSFWIGHRPEENARALRTGSSTKSPLACSNQHRQFFDSLQGFYRCTALHWFQQAGWLRPGETTRMEEILRRLPSTDPTHEWVRWLLDWLEAGSLLRQEGGLIRLTESGQSRETQDQILGLEARRGLILRAIPELAPQMRLLELTGEAFRTGLAAQAPGAVAPLEKALLRSVLECNHRFAEESEAQIQRVLDDHFAGFLNHPPASVRLVENGLGSFSPLRAALTFFSRIGCPIELQDEDLGDGPACLKRELAQAIVPTIRIQARAPAESPPAQGEQVTLTLVHAFSPWGRPEGPSPRVCPEQEASPAKGGFVLRLEDGEGDFLSLVLGRLDTRWLRIPESGESAIPSLGRRTVVGPTSPGSASARGASARAEEGLQAAEVAEGVVRGAVARVLGVAEAEVDPQASFREYDLNSIMLAQVYLELKGLFGDWISPQLLLNQDSVAKLTQAISGAAPPGSGVPFCQRATGLSALPVANAPHGPAASTSETESTPLLQADAARRFRAPSGWDMEFILEGGTREEPILWLTALAFTKGIWDSQVRELGGGHRLVFPHLPGHAGSGLSPTGFSFESLADDLAALLDALEIPKVHLVGWCMAGNVGQVFATRHAARLRSLTLVCTTPTDARLRGLSAEDLQTYAHSPLYTYEIEFQNLVRNGWLTEAARAELLERVHRHFCVVDPLATLHYIEHLFRFDTRAQLSQVKIPTLVVAGQWDIAFPADQVRLLHEGIDGSRYHEFMKSGHMPFLTQPDLFNYLLEDFLRSAKHTRDKLS